MFGTRLVRDVVGYGLVSTHIGWGAARICCLFKEPPALKLGCECLGMNLQGVWKCLQSVNMPTRFTTNSWKSVRLFFVFGLHRRLWRRPT